VPEELNATDGRLSELLLHMAEVLPFPKTRGKR
jgi:hypothetical protein